MAYIDPGTSELTRNVLALVQQMSARKDARATALLGRLQPGQALAAIPGAADALKRITGREFPDTYVPIPETIEHQIASDMARAYAGASPETRQRRTETAVENVVAGTTGVRTAKSAGSEAAAIETEQGTRAGVASVVAEPTIEAARASGKAAVAQAQTQAVVSESQRGLAEAGAATIAQAPDAQRSAAGQVIILGDKLLSELQTRQNGEYIKQTVQGFAASALANPEGTQLDKILKETFGFGITTAATAGVLGMDDYLKLRTQISLAQIQNSGNVQEALAKAKIDYAKTVAENSGGNLSLDDVLAFLDTRASGQPIPNTPKGQLFTTMTEAGYNAYVRGEVAKGSPTGQALSGFLDMAKTFKDSPDVLQAGGDWVRRMVAMNETVRQFGERPDPNLAGSADQKAVLTAQRAAWDQLFASELGKIPGIDLDHGRFLGIDFLNPDKPRVTGGPSTQLPVGSEGSADASGVDPASIQAVNDLIESMKKFQFPTGTPPDSAPRQ